MTCIDLNKFHARVIEFGDIDIETWNWVWQRFQFHSSTRDFIFILNQQSPRMRIATILRFWLISQILKYSFPKLT